ncbi:DUF4190 domain-containing protein [Corynebacterium nasicanis]|uniref:DUF4190 domain-containing protein n=1 Tax=Corynebacterium nasicanis TaxID=1448267 RepID=A0ABW1Q8X6_9CORY
MSTPFDHNDPQRPAGDAYGGSGGYDGYGGYQEPVGGATWAVDAPKNKVAPWALGVGILALIAGISVFFSGAAFIVGLIGVILAVVALARGRSIPAPGRRTGMSVAGLVLSIIAIVLSVIFWVIVVVVFRETGMATCLELTDPAQQQTCIENSLNEWIES